MLQRMFAALAFTLAVAFGMPSLAQAKTDAPAPKEPTIQQIYEAANGGRMSDADAMIAKVLKDHPSSAKAHFVHSELLSTTREASSRRRRRCRPNSISPSPRPSSGSRTSSTSRRRRPGARPLA